MHWLLAAGGLGIETGKTKSGGGLYVFALETDISDELRCMEAENKDAAGGPPGAIFRPALP